jgi:hypothetical protein
MPTNTWEPISTYTAPSAQSTVSFLDIPQTYKNLVVRGSVIPLNSGASYLTVRFNNNSGTVYDSIQMYAATSSSSLVVTSATNFEIIGNQFQTFRVFPLEIEINSYASTTKYKTAFLSARPADNTSRYMIGSFRDTSNPISRIDIISSATTIDTGSKFTLWGLA